MQFYSASRVRQIQLRSRRKSTFVLRQQMRSDRIQDSARISQAIRTDKSGQTSPKRSLVGSTPRRVQKSEQQLQLVLDLQEAHFRMVRVQQQAKRLSQIS